MDYSTAESTRAGPTTVVITGLDELNDSLRINGLIKLNVNTCTTTFLRYDRKDSDLRKSLSLHPDTLKYIFWESTKMNSLDGPSNTARVEEGSCG
jgi:hypothetical protein